jgi:nucleotide-binding universal stress UspA family protein
MKMEGIRKIVVATDFSPESDRALDEAVHLARRLDAALDLLHVREPFAYATANALMAVPERTEEYMDWVDQSLDERRDRVASLGVPCITNSLHGFAATLIVEHATKAGADLILLGRHGRGRLPTHLLGSVAKRVVEKSHCPVLVVPSP